MKKFLLASICLLATTGMAQELFPELAGLGKPTQTKEIEVEISENNVVSSEQATQEDAENTAESTVEQTETAEQASAETPDTPVASKTGEEDEDEEDDEKIQIYMADANATLTPNDNFSYCFGEIKFASNLKYPVQSLEVSLTYASFTDTYKVSNLTKDEEKSVSITMVGKACEHILDMPQMEIKRCVVENMDPEKCKQKVQFIPLRGS